MELPEQPYSFRDQRQERIYRLLRLIGDGPAAFFRDACKFMDSPLDFHSTTHLIGHLMREVEGALRDVLAPHVPDGENQHRREIQSILSILVIPEDHPAAQLWLRLPGRGGLQSRAHRDAQFMPRLIDDRFLRDWDSLLVILDYVLEKFEQTYLTYHDILDELLNVQHRENALNLNDPSDWPSYAGG